MSSSSSNATSNSTSTTSNNTTAHTVATTASHALAHSSSGLGASGSLSNSSNGSAVTSTVHFSHQQLVSNASAACQFYFPAPSHQLTAYHDATHLSQLSAHSHPNYRNHMNSLDADYDDTAPPSQLAATPISTHSGRRPRLDAKSLRSSDGGSSGNGSDVELLSSRKAKNRSQQANYYEVGVASAASTRSESKSRLKQRGLDQVPKEMRTSKQSFTQAMDKPCEFFVDVM